MKQYKAIIYDLDGTVLNTFDMNMIPLLQIIKEELGETWNLEQVHQYYAYPGIKTLEELGFKDIATTYQRWVDYVNAYENGATLYDGFNEVFQTLQDLKIDQAIVSSKMRKQYDIDFKQKGYDHFMSAVVLYEDTTIHKPHPEPLLSCLQRLDISPHQALYIGDSLADSQAAYDAGIDFAFAMWGSVVSEDEIEATYVLKHPLDILTKTKETQ